MKKKATLYVLVVCLAGLSAPAALLPCTLAVVSGKAARDGRPLMWKNRDTSNPDNQMMFFAGSKYRFIGLVEAQDKKGKEVFGGLNSEGFAIMNSQSDDLAGKGKDGADNGVLMNLALGECASVRDFEALLDRVKGKYDLAANFGVIDAEGNACFYETAPSAYVKFDTRDPRVAPFGYLVKTNYAFTSPDLSAGGGFIRFERISRIFRSARAENRITPRFILREAARDLVNEKTHSHPLSEELPRDPAAPLYINTNDTINRNSSVSAMLFQGAPARDKAYLATMWVVLGQPVSSAAIPLWTGAGKVPGVTAAGKTTAPLNDLSKAIAAYLYPDSRGHMRQYLNVNRLRTYGGEGVLAKIMRIEDRVLEQTFARLAEWEKEKPREADVAAFEDELAAWVYDSLKSSFGLSPDSN